MNDHSRSVDIRHHSLKQDYVEGTMRIGGVASLNNTSDILTKNLQPPLHAKHCTPLHILTPTTNSRTITNNVVYSYKHPPPTLTKQQKRKERKKRQRERNYRLLAHARSTLNQTTLPLRQHRDRQPLNTSCPDAH